MISLGLSVPFCKMGVVSLLCLDCQVVQGLMYSLEPRETTTICDPPLGSVLLHGAQESPGMFLTGGFRSAGLRWAWHCACLSSARGAAAVSGPHSQEQQCRLDYALGCARHWAGACMPILTPILMAPLPGKRGHPVYRWGSRGPERSMPHPGTHSQTGTPGSQSQACGVYRVLVHESKPLHRPLGPARGDLGYTQDMKASSSGLQAVVGRDSLRLWELTPGKARQRAGRRGEDVGVFWGKNKPPAIPCEPQPRPDPFSPSLHLYRVPAQGSFPRPRRAGVPGVGRTVTPFLSLIHSVALGKSHDVSEPQCPL
ncbi:PREDICTED: uncharacterized protein LOC106726697 [Myotis brandtii]|uniref:uncharacterized protein LOC106726697 n=1 Tax=Myotis brandtii TaxID=109478 RepID=UPI000704421D|nr:PREDICTED: uncharacterized protein LOC106726697 [Myotis brandtii]